MITYRTAAGGSDTLWNLAITVCVSKATDRAYKTKLSEYVSPAGVRDVVEDDQTLGGIASSVEVTQANITAVEVAGVEYWAAVFDVEVLA